MINQTLKKILFVFLFFLAALLVVFFSTIPIIKKLSDLSKSIKTKELLLNQKNKKQESLPKIIKDLNTFKKDPLFSSAFITPGKEINFIESIEKDAREAGVKQKIDMPKSSQNNKETPITITIEGNYPSLVKYLYLLEKEKYYININELKIASSPILNSSSVPLRANISAHIYFK